ncbi:MAG: class I SAM-dependent DNA methyltransferase [Candidatus Kapaibacterium sp.]
MKSIQDTNRELWSWEFSKNVLLYPDDRVAAMVLKHLGPNPGNALDIGCGSGRHLRLMADCGYQAYGIDIVDTAVKYSESLKKQYPNIRHVYLKEILNYNPDIKFDLILAWGVLFLSRKHEIRARLNKINSFMNPGAALICNFRTYDNWFYGLGREIERGFFILDDRAGPYSEMYYHFFKPEEVNELLKEAGFDIRSTEYLQLYKNNMKEKNSWYITYVIKQS